jgi:hypothetical protein
MTDSLYQVLRRLVRDLWVVARQAMEGATP